MIASTSYREKMFLILSDVFIYFLDYIVFFAGISHRPQTVQLYADVIILAMWHKQLSAYTTT